MFIYVAGVSRTSRVDDGDDVAPFENCVRFGAFLFESAMSVFPFLFGLRFDTLLDKLLGHDRD